MAATTVTYVLKPEMRVVLYIDLDLRDKRLASMEDVHPIHTTSDTSLPAVLDIQPSTSTLKRPPSPSFEAVDEEITRKRFKEDSPEQIAQTPIASTSKYDAMVEDLAQELQCGCCAELVYRPVVVSPCQHFFCGRYS